MLKNIISKIPRRAARKMIVNAGQAVQSTARRQFSYDCSHPAAVAWFNHTLWVTATSRVSDPRLIEVDSFDSRFEHTYEEECDKVNEMCWPKKEPPEGYDFAQHICDQLKDMAESRENNPNPYNC